MEKDCYYTKIIEIDRDGFFAYCPEIQGCYTSGETFSEAKRNLLDAIALKVEDITQSNEGNIEGHADRDVCDMRE